MRLTFTVLRRGFFLGATIALSLAPHASCAAAKSDADPTEPEATWQGPVTVENPFATVHAPTLPSVGPVAGDVLANDAPAVYRLPNVPPTGAESFGAMSSEEPEIALPSESTSGECVGPDLKSDNGSLPAVPARAVRIRVAQAMPTQSTPNDLSDSESTPVYTEPMVRIGMPEIVQRNTVPLSADEMLQPASQYLHLYTPTTNELTLQMLPSVQRAFDLTQRGALFAAETEFVQVLRRIAQANDAATGDDAHARALGAGLRALDEAADFVPAGIQVEAELDVPTTASSHRTPVLRDYPHKVMPHEAVALYHHYAEQQLARAVGGEQAGSMALHGLGKICALQAARNDDVARSRQRSMAMYSAALAARPDNHLAANELGVLLCQSGRPAEAARVFERTIDASPSALAYHNLAIAQRKLGMLGQADANERESQRVAAWERSNGDVSRHMGVRWVSRDEIARVAQPAPLASAYSAGNVNAPQTGQALPAGPAASTSPWQQAVKVARTLPLPGVGGVRGQRGPTRNAGVAPPATAPPTNTTHWR